MKNYLTQKGLNSDRNTDIYETEIDTESFWVGGVIKWFMSLLNKKLMG